jgi:Mg-chelatase subunit ChlD
VAQQGGRRHRRNTLHVIVMDTSMSMHREEVLERRSGACRS